MLNSAKHDLQSSFYQTESEEDQYLASPSPRDYIITNVKSDSEGNNTITKIEGLFLNIRYKSFYERLTKKVVYETCKFFMYSVSYMSSKYWVVYYRIRLG